MHLQALCQQISTGLIVCCIGEGKDAADHVQRSVYCSMNIRWRVLNIGPATFLKSVGLFVVSAFDFHRGLPVD